MTRDLNPGLELWSPTVWAHNPGSLMYLLYTLPGKHLKPNSCGTMDITLCNPKHWELWGFVS